MDSQAEVAIEEHTTNTGQCMQIDILNGSEEVTQEEFTSEAKTIEEVVNAVVDSAIEESTVTDIKTKKSVSQSKSKEETVFSVEKEKEMGEKQSNKKSKSKKIMKIDAKHAKQAAEEEKEDSEYEDNAESEDSLEEDDDSVSTKSAAEDSVHDEQDNEDEKKKETSKSLKMKQLADAAEKLKKKNKNLASKIKDVAQSQKDESISKGRSKRALNSSMGNAIESSKKQKTEKGSIVKKSTGRTRQVKQPLKERTSKTNAASKAKKIATINGPTKKATKTDMKKLQIQNKAKVSKGIPDIKLASKKTKKSTKLSSKDAHIKYRTRLGLIPDEEFQILDQAWISIYEPSLKKRKTYEEGFFPLKWTKILKEVAEEKGFHILGCLPHYGRTIEDTNLKAYEVKPQIVDKDKENEYNEVGYKNIQAQRVYVGKKNGAGREQKSQFAFCSEDTKPDELWYAIKEILDGESSDD